MNYYLKNIAYKELLNELPPQYIDLGIFDPPYNLSKANWDTFDSDVEFLDFTYEWLDLALPKIKPGGSFYIFNTPANCAHIFSYLYSNPKYVFQNWITWDKRDGQGGSKYKFCPRQESILFYSVESERPDTFNYDDIRIPYDTPRRKYTKNGKPWFPNPKGRLCSDVWHIVSERHVTKINGKTQKAWHPTVKPSAMMDRIIKVSSNEGDRVLDMFSGSGQTLMSCLKLDRRFIGCELNTDYYNGILEKVKNIDNPI